MNESIAAEPIKSVFGIELRSKGQGVAQAHVTSDEGVKTLSWDRFVRLKAAADAIVESKALTVLDVGGFDGALAFFLPGVAVDVVDPVTTGGSLFDLPAGERSYDVVAGIDVLEHIHPDKRTQGMREMARVAASHVVLNYPCSESRDAQELVLQLTDNALIREHVEWPLPDSASVLADFSALGFQGTYKPHASVALWLNQYVLLSRLPDAAAAINRHLVENHRDEPFSRALYHLLVMRRKGR